MGVTSPLNLRVKHVYLLFIYFTGTTFTEVSACIYFYFCLFNVVYLLSPLCNQIVYYCTDGGNVSVSIATIKLLVISNRMC